MLTASKPTVESGGYAHVGGVDVGVVPVVLTAGVVPVVVLVLAAAVTVKIAHAAIRPTMGTANIAERLGDGGCPVVRRSL
jgi:hypothetical protein